MFALGLPAFSLFYVLLRSYYAQENTKTPFLINLGFNLLHIAIGLSLFYSLPEGYQVAGLAFGYSLAYVITCVFTWRRVGKRVPDLLNHGHLRLIVRVTLASLVSGAGAYLFVTGLIMNSDQASLLQLGFCIASFAASFSLLYLALAKVLRISEVWAVLALVRRK
jgi:putative peptidoglycan lipid II flippase